MTDFKKRTQSLESKVKVRDVRFGIGFLNDERLDFGEVVNVGMRVP